MERLVLCWCCCCGSIIPHKYSYWVRSSPGYSRTRVVRTRPCTRKRTDILGLIRQTVSMNEVSRVFMRGLGFSMASLLQVAVALLATSLMSAVGPCRAQSPNVEYGPSPQLAAATKSILPRVHVAKAKGWNDHAQPQGGEGMRVSVYADHLQHPRWLYVLPNGDVLVAESEAPAKPDDSRRIGGKVRKLVMKRAGSGADPSANRITLLRESKQGSVEKHVFLQDLTSPIGMALVGNTFFVADSDAVLSFPYRPGDMEIKSAPTELTALPAGTINHHWTKSLLASPDGQHLYVGVGSNSN